MRRSGSGDVRFGNYAIAIAFSKRNNRKIKTAASTGQKKMEYGKIGLGNRQNINKHTLWLVVPQLKENVTERQVKQFAQSL